MSKIPQEAISLCDLREANAARQKEWCPDQLPDLSFRGNELGGECGEALNVIKKLERERHGWAGSRATVDDLADELADVVICADLTALAAGIDLNLAVARKFNATSEKVGLATRLHTDAARAQGAEVAPIAYTNSLILEFNVNGNFIIDAMIFPKGTLRPEQEVALYTAPPAPQPTEADGIEKAAQFIEKQISDYVQEHGSYDPSTGQTEFTEAGEAYVVTLEELAEAIRALAGDKS